MDIQYTTEKRDYREGGIHLLSLWLCHITLTGEEEQLSSLSDFYEGWLADVREACEGELLPLLRRAYMDDPSPRKRFTHRPCVVRCTVTHENVRHRRFGDTVSVTRRVDMTRGDEALTLLHDTDRIELTYGCVVS